MNKIVGTLVLMTFGLSVLSADVSDNIVKILQDQTGKKISVLKIESLKGSPDFKIAVIKDMETKYEIPIFVSKDGKTMIGLSNVFFSDNKNDAMLVDEVYKKTQEHNIQQQNSAKLDALFDSIPSDYVISIPSTTKGNQKITYIVSDPMCPHCQQELKGIDSRLKDTNIKMVVVGFLGKESGIKSALVLEKIKAAKTPSEKIAILNEIYNPSYKANGAKDTEIKKVENITKKISDSGIIKYVPYIYEYQK
ncbi:disulfide isomerase [Helicobacter cappadocius]|uniref:Disulfide isomerase n=1 Tax=Helicobacter cappadocius TaxID=3063998 RepID=A0AA90T9C3_9HELI|nr:MULTISPECIES: disulfide isomerase [unclassified Helicobacter]MDO7253157.1 disulfide isomerase [Helicobacter sp. faydin-H75]MDP2538717.1 disulfide isomerase [Helicobacter sp. faydin-H76]